LGLVAQGRADEGIAFNPLPDVYTASVCGVESSQLGLLSKVVSVTNKARLWHCESHLSTAKSTDAKAVAEGWTFCQEMACSPEKRKVLPLAEPEIVTGRNGLFRIASRMFLCLF